MTLFYRDSPFRGFQFDISLTDESMTLASNSIVQREKLVEALEGSARFDVELVREPSAGDRPKTLMIVTQLQTRNGRAMKARTFVMHENDWLVESGNEFSDYTVLTDEQFRRIAITSLSKYAESAGIRANTKSLPQSFQFTEEIDNKGGQGLTDAFLRVFPDFDLMGMNFHYQKPLGAGSEYENERIVRILSGLDETGPYPKPKSSWVLRYGDRLVANEMMPNGYLVLAEDEFNALYPV